MILFANMGLTTSCFAAARAVHFGACLLWFGVLAFDRLVAVSPEFRGQTGIGVWWRSRLRWFGGIALVLILVSGVAWFALVAANMSGLPLRQAVQPQVWQKVWGETLFGTVWKIRLVFWLAAVLATAAFYFWQNLSHLSEKLIWLELFFAAFLLGSLAWAGHGREGSAWHLGADVLHLLVAGIWPAGLLPLILVLRKFRQSPVGNRPSISAITRTVRRFSVVSLASVSLLTVTGWVNGWYLVGSFANLFHLTYGHWLLAKMAIFGLAVALGAANLLRWKPRLLTSLNAGGGSACELPAAKLLRNVELELFFGSVIILVVGVLGVLPPASH